MKYIRKVTALVLAIIFCAAIVIGLGVIFSVKNVNVEFIDYTGQHNEEFERTRKNLNSLVGSGMLFISDDDVESKLSDERVIAVESYERIYPCTVNVVLKERIECFASVSDGIVYVYDEDGAFMRTERGEGDYLNPSDSSPDIIVSGEKAGTLTAEEYKSVGVLLNNFKYSFGSLRKLVKSVVVYPSVNSANVYLRSGISIVVSDWDKNAREKMAAVYDCYRSLSDAQKIDAGGKITVADGAAGAQPVAIYVIVR